MQSKIYALLALTALAPALACAGSASGDSGFATLADPYEEVRTALLHDTLDGVAEHARSIERAAHGLAADFDAEAAGVPAAAAEEARTLLPRMAEAARTLAQAGDLAAARAAFGELTEPLVRYRELAGDNGVQLAYCPMAGKSWLQKDPETIGNPYYGQSMADCGSFVDG